MNLGWLPSPSRGLFIRFDPFLFRSLQHSLSGEHLTKVEDIRKCIDDLIASKAPAFFRERIPKTAR